MSKLILIAEAEETVAAILAGHLQNEGFRTVWAADGEQAATMHAALKPDLVLLDILMPARDGWDVLGELRRRGETPVIVITALDKDKDKIQALRIGANDYIVKPFNPAEVVARVHAALRRSFGERQPDVTRVGQLEIDVENYIVSVVTAEGRRRLNLTLTEFRLLAQMAQAPMRLFSRADLSAACLRGQAVNDRTIDSHLSKLRKKLDEAGAPGLVVSVRGLGFRLEPDM